jgi:hypothetical protein
MNGDRARRKSAGPQLTDENHERTTERLGRIATFFRCTAFY